MSDLTKQEAIIQKKWEESTIQNNFVFSKTMEMNPDLCQQLVENILDEKIESISYPEREKVLENRIDSKGVRLDVYLKDNADRVFDLEMQVSSSSDNLAKRIRYYQGLIDEENLKRGEHYDKLNPTYIIFICPFVPFKKQNQYIYTFRDRCDQVPSLILPNDAVKIFLSTKGKEGKISSELKNFLNYVENGVVEGSFVQKLDKAVYAIKTNEKARSIFMGYEMDLLERELKGERKTEFKVFTNIMTPILQNGKDIDYGIKICKLALPNWGMAKINSKIAELAHKLDVTLPTAPQR